MSATQPLSLSAFHDKLPKHTASPTNNIHAYISDLPCPTVGSGSSTHALPSISPARKVEEDLSIDDSTDDTGEFIANAIPAELKEHGSYRSRIRVIQCRLYLLRCEVLQSTVNAVEQNPWAQCRNVSIHDLYRKILYCARKTQQLAEAVSNHELQARSRYWSGRGCGGLCDWETAIGHFAAAVKLHVPNDNPRNRPHQQRTVLHSKKDDSEFLLQSVTRHYDEGVRKKKEARQAVHRQQANQSPSPVDDTKRGTSKEPRWMPFYERMIHQAKQSATERRSSRGLNQLLSGKSAYILNNEETAILKKRLNLNDGKRAIREIFTAEDWLYILRGDEATENRKDNIEYNNVNSYDSPSDHEQNQHSKPFRTPSPDSTINISQHSSLKISHNLGAELDLAGYQSSRTTPSLLGSTRSPSPEEEDETPSPLVADLQGRRNVKLPPISTSTIQKDARLGEAVQVPFTPTDSEVEKDWNEAETIEIGYNDKGQAIGSDDFVSMVFGEKTGESGNLTPATGADNE